MSAVPEPATPPLLGSILCERFSLDPSQLERALHLQKDNPGRIGALLIQLGLVSERDVAGALAHQFGMGLADVADYPTERLLTGRVSREFMIRAQAIELEEDADRIVLALADPLDRFTPEAVRLATGKAIEVRVGVRAEIETAHRAQNEGDEGELAEIVGTYAGVGADGDADDIEHLRDLASEAPIIRLVNLLIARAMQARASDIHIEPFEGRLNVRYRIDGVLKGVEAPPVQSTAAVISRIKVMAELNIAERRLPQDGRVKIRVEGKVTDLRISTMPTLHGESVVMRILDKGSVPLDFESLGFTGPLRDAIAKVLRRPQGIVLVTGPTGSGKTTTLYTALQMLNTPERKILTVEDPVEYQLDGINQIQIKPQIGLSFASALRSILRQDPDVIMVGEMRDVETARIAVQSALTGHLVFSTLHTNDAPSSVTRLLEMGIEDYLVTSTVNAIVAQRLVRTLCPDCKRSTPAEPAIVEELGLRRFAGEGEALSLWQAAGCSRCDDTGYMGRIGIIELMELNDELRRCILANTDASVIADTARRLGILGMHEDGLRKVVEGITTIEEIERVTRES